MHVAIPQREVPQRRWPRCGGNCWTTETPNYHRKSLPLICDHLLGVACNVDQYAGFVPYLSSIYIDNQSTTPSSPPPWQGWENEIVAYGRKYLTKCHVLILYRWLWSQGIFWAQQIWNTTIFRGQDNFVPYLWWIVAYGRENLANGHKLILNRWSWSQWLFWVQKLWYRTIFRGQNILKSFYL